MSAFASVGAIPPLHIWEGVVSRPVHGERVTFSLIELEPDAVVPEHSHENEQVGILIEGSLRFRIGDESRDVGPGDIWRILANVPHSVVTGPGGAVLVEVFAPARDDWGDVEAGNPRPPRWP
jgi:quercetin dioxygenase-like cupin family protein